ncbi:MAG: putative translation initiation inhibitor, yjgF family [Firmicutes bacterium]|nr:putative translation initiation inhibitor, yjgF family [Bacillota bacterium]
MHLERTNYSSGAPLEAKAGYSRVVKVGPFVYVGGTTAVQADGTVYGKNDGYAQAKFVFEKMLKCMAEAGANASEVVKVKLYTTDMSRAAEYAKAYTEIFKAIKPLFTMVGIAALNRPSQLVEIEIDAIIGCTQKLQ